MARESQGLQIALIVFVIFTVVLGVLAFLGFKGYGEAQTFRVEAEAKANEAKTAQTAAESENMHLKQIMGHAETAMLSEVDDGFNKDKLTYAQNYNDANVTYRALCQWLFDEVQRKNAALSEEKARVQQYKDLNASLEKAKEDQIAQLLDRAKKAEADLAARQAEFQQAQQLSIATTGKLRTDKNNLFQEHEATKALAATTIGERDKTIGNQGALIVKYQKTIEDMDPPIVEQPDGLITYAGRGDTVSINLGKVHGLARLTNFAVYARDMTDVTSAGRKGAIEVIDVGENSAVAQIVDEEVSNPILAGDKIFTPLWKAGQREHFALTCGMDLDDDGRSDVDEVRNIITSNGGIVDLWLDDAGKKYGSGITMATKYLVEGDQPTEGSTTERLNARKWILDERDRLNLQTMSLDELLNRMGYERKVHVVRYDSPNPNDFRAQPPEGVPRESSGRVSDIFEKRNPPRSAVNSAY